jgi:hypothetical protein
MCSVTEGPLENLYFCRIEVDIEQKVHCSFFKMEFNFLQSVCVLPYHTCTSSAVGSWQLVFLSKNNNNALCSVFSTRVIIHVRACYIRPLYIFQHSVTTFIISSFFIRIPVYSVTVFLSINLSQHPTYI